MVSQTNEQALEAAIEKQLTGTRLEDQNSIADRDIPFSSNHGYQLGYPRNFDARYAIDKKQFWAFLEATQKDELEKLEKTGTDWQQKVLDRYDRLVKKYGLLYLLKKGLSVDNAHLTLLTPHRSPVAQRRSGNGLQPIFSAVPDRCVIHWQTRCKRLTWCCL